LELVRREPIGKARTKAASRNAQSEASLGRGLSQIQILPFWAAR